MAASTDPKFVRIVDAVGLFSISRSTFERAIRAGQLTAHKRGRLTLLETREVEGWITGRTAPAQPAA